MNNEELLNILEKRVTKNTYFKKEYDWNEIKNRICKNDKIINSLIYMEETGGEPNLVNYNESDDKYIFMDTSIESPNRRSFCYANKALQSRKKTNQRIVQWKFVNNTILQC